MEKYIPSIERDGGTRGNHELPPSVFFTARPHLLMAVTGCDEFRDLGVWPDNRVMQAYGRSLDILDRSNASFNREELADLYNSTLGEAENSWDYCEPPGVWIRSQSNYIRHCFREPTGKWWLLTRVPWGKGGSYSQFAFVPQVRPGVVDSPLADLAGMGVDQEIFLPPATLEWSEFIGELYKLSDRWIEGERVIWSLPYAGFTRLGQVRESVTLETARGLISAIRGERLSLADLSWRELEDIVAELLRNKGLEIVRQRSTPQGGRDIIARGELIPGLDPITMAVEVKHRRVVGRPEVERALWQNRRFAAVLFVTSGRFTAGVLREKTLPENHIRLVLKDGVALWDMIRSYS